MKTILALLVASSMSLLSSGTSRADDHDHMMMTPKDIKWGDAPPALPPGAKLAVMYGDPSKPGLFIIRLKMPAGYKIPAHSHPTDEMITVISGTFMMGMADKLDAKTAKGYAAGSFLFTPAKNNHFAMANKETIVEVSSMGPFGINYVNPDDDPSKKAAATTPAPTTPAKK